MLRACIVVAGFLGMIIPGYSQSSHQGTIEGLLKDPSGAVVPSATLKATNLGTSAVFSATSNTEGLFYFLGLPVATYQIAIEKAGFATLSIKNVVVTVGARVHLALTLPLAEKVETLTVEEGTPLLETTRSHVSTTIDNSTLTRLPSNGRSFMDLVLLTPGVTRDVRGGFSFAGQREMNSLLVDGADNNDYYWNETLGRDGFSPGGTGAYQFSEEAVQEFQVNSNAYSAEFGRAGGGVISVITKSGNNQFHGSAFWFYRDQSLNANDPVNKLNGQPREPFHFNQFGSTVSGPAVRDKLFFFANYEGQRSNQTNSVSLNLPAGFLLSTNPSVAVFQQRALDYLSPRATSWVRSLDQNVVLTRMDWLLSNRSLLTGRWSRQRWVGPNTTGDPQESFENGGRALLNTDALSFSLTSTLAANTVNAARFSFVRGFNAFLSDSIDPQASVFQDGQLVLTVGRSAAGPQEEITQQWQVSDVLSHSRGRHNLKAGVDLIVGKVKFFNAANFAGSYRFVSLESFGRSLSDQPDPRAGEFYRQTFSGSGTPGSTTHPDLTAWAGFLQDEWRLRPGLTLNLGLRYDVQLIAKPPVRNPSPALEAAGLDTSFFRVDTNNLAPRFGVAWQPLQSQRMVLRAGYGLYYPMIPALITARTHFQNGVSVQSRSLLGGTPNSQLIPAYPNTLCGEPDPASVSPSCAPPPAGAGKPTIMLFSRDYVQPYTQQGSLEVEFQLQANLAASVTYLGVRGVHLLRTRDTNLGLPTTPTQIAIADTNTVLIYQKFTSPRPLSDFDRIFQFESNANSIYHGLAFQVVKRFSSNFQFLSGYTLGKVIDDNPDGYYINPNPGDFRQIADPSNARADRSVGLDDQRQRLVLSGIWNLEYKKDLRGFAKALFGGWEISGIFTAQRGQPYSGKVNSDLNNDGNFATDRTPGLGRNTFYAPSMIALDPRVSRRVPLGERAQLVLAWEAFNVLNRANYTQVRTTQHEFSNSPLACGVAGLPCLVPQNTGLSAFGTPVASAGPRVIQLSARLVF